MSKVNDRASQFGQFIQGLIFSHTFLGAAFMPTIGFSRPWLLARFMLSQHFSCQSKSARLMPRPHLCKSLTLKLIHYPPLGIIPTVSGGGSIKIRSTKSKIHTVNTAAIAFRGEHIMQKGKKVARKVHVKENGER